MSRKNKILLACAIAIFTLIVFTAAILPLIVRSQAVKAIEQETGRKTRLEKVSINPFTLTVVIKGFAIESKDGGAFISVGSLRTSLGLASIYRRALILSEVAIDSPALSFSRLAANSYSFNDIIDRLKAKPKKESKGEMLFSVNNISISNGSLDFDDKAVSGGRKHTVRDLKIAVPFISNMPYLVEKYTDPHVSAVVNGAPFSFDGKVKPLSKSLETSVHIRLKNLSVPEYVAYSPVPPPANIVSGALTVDSDITYRIHSDKKPQLHIKGMVRLESFAATMKNGAPLVKLPLFEVKASLLEVLAKKFALESVLLDGLELAVTRSAKGEWMYQQLLPKPTSKQATNEASPPKTDAPATPPVLLQINDVAFKNGVIRFSDALPAGGFKSEISQIDASIKNFSTESGKSADYDLSLLLDKEATFSTDGSFTLAPLSASASSELSGLKLQRAWPYLSQFLTAPLKGSLDLSSEVTYTKEDGLVLDQGTLLLSAFSTRYGDKEGFDLSRFEISGAGFNQKNNSAEIAEIKLSKGDLTLSREADGSLSLLSLLKSGGSTSAPATQAGTPAPATPKPAKADSPKKQSEKDLSFTLKKFQVDRFNAAFTDKTRSEKPRFALNNTSLTLTNLKGPKFTPAGLRFASTFNKATPLTAKGEITPQPFHYKGSLSVGRLPLRDFDAYFPSNLNVFLQSGFADTNMNLDVALKDGKPLGYFRGSAGVRGFHAVDTVSEEDLLKWESLQLDDIQGSLEPFSLALRQIALNGVYSRIIIRKDGTLNLQNLVEKPKEQPQAAGNKGLGDKIPAASATAPTPGAPQKTAAAQPSNIRIDAITIQDGTLSFTDNHLPQRFTTTFFNLGGRVSGLSSEDSKLADVDLRGNLENHSPLQITGQINPLRGDLFVDLKISFKDIELSPATPYTGRFLGYTVEKGKLFLDLKYHIDKKQLNSENKVFIDQFTFGEKVESDKATSLPVKLGLALLKDRKGEIHLDLPVTGRTDDPKFSIWGVVWQVVTNVLVKAVTSPFALLSSMMGSDQDFSAVSFGTGVATLPSGEEQKLAALSKALQDRPALKVELKGFVDRERDTEGYRSHLLERKLKNEKYLFLKDEGSLKEGEKAENIQVLPEEQPKYLAAVYKKEKFPKPRNMLGLVKDLPPDEMRKLIVTNTVVGDPELQTLARERVLAVKNYLVLKGGIAPERVFEKNDNIFKAPEKDTVSRSRVELNAIAQ